MLKWMENHILARHTFDFSIVQPKVQQTKNEDTTMDVDETGDGKTWDHDFEQFSDEQTRSSWKDSPVFEAAAESSSTSRLSKPIAEISTFPLCENNVLESKLKEHKYDCSKIERECFDCAVKVLNENLQDHLDKEHQKRIVVFDACHNQVTYTQLGKHKSECPKIERKCSDCGANVLNEKIQNHQEEECQKRVVLCEACKSAMSYDEFSEHDQECVEKPVVCDDCEGEVLRKEKVKHASECPMRVVGCESCKGFYAYSTEKEHREQCEKKKLACEYCKLELKGDGEKNAHLETCEQTLIGCAFKAFGCNEKAPRKDMQEHEKDPHNALLNQVILGLQERIENLERPLTALVKKLRNPDSVGTGQ
ncbi:TNF receptor-associated factor 4 isoform X1 [Ixodes scapularis]|uniref:TNF receptor-associated factor 4 isoform X1 n=2 Tax=Ixodes scapularis TaxID=6945 RepID=UPI001A9CDDF0|nr:TNF receptor-associated factor 4 isoform X1 [Ixodes scapularis]